MMLNFAISNDTNLYGFEMYSHFTYTVIQIISENYCSLQTYTCHNLSRHRDTVINTFIHTYKLSGNITELYK